MTWVNSRGAGLLALEAIFTTIITLAIIGRFWSIRILRRKVLVADYLVLVAWAAAISFNCCIMWCCANGLGADSAQLSQAQQAIQAKSLFAATFTWTTATVFCKLSVLFFCMQIFDHLQSFRLASRVLVGLCIAYEIAFIPVFVTQCIPPQASWTGKGHCRKVETEEIASVVGNLILDTAVVILPLPYIWTLQMPAFRRFGISVIFSIGFAIVAIICWRLSFTIRLESGKVDPGYGIYVVAMQSTLEVSLGILAACLPTLYVVSGRAVMPKALGLLSSLREKLTQWGISHSERSAVSQTDDGKNSSGGDNPTDRVESASSEQIPFDYLGDNSHLSARPRGAANAFAPDRKHTGADEIRVYREINIEEQENTWM